MANRSMDAKCKRAVSQRQALGAAEGSKPAYRTNKPLLREIASNAQHMVKKYGVDTVDTKEVVYVVYNPSIYRAPKPLALRCWATQSDGLIKRADYFKR